ncbi:DNA ligase [Aestuariicella hydrocarbonica]|uniref:DNA ligase n=1 Tax=Pseudomaricurvus hydrocarbonicus TaxID=1470433 RepID=A0A9E5MPU5_9GAMM|nr:DNA ligase [Aestuariicella hydrocarbonica]NHO68226.1 DNA ligase [Aestuariicella hydrocarbonica]
MGLRQAGAVCTALLIAVIQGGAAVLAAAPDLLLATSYASGVQVSEYWVSEKYDGVRAYWNGQQLLSRQGNVYVAPAWFTEDFPPTPLDGELWLGRQRFQALVSVVRQQQPHDGWRQVTYQVFDLPTASGAFDLRLPRLQQTVSDAGVPWLRAVPQFRVADEAQLLDLLAEYVAQGAEGLMLHRGAAEYRAGRSEDLIKLKPSQDAEAVVIEHLPGKGKYTGMLGAVVVEMPTGQRFRIGSGFSDQQRRQPPPTGSVITYQYNGFTQRGIPRFARFLRVRDD